MIRNIALACALVCFVGLFLALRLGPKQDAQAQGLKPTFRAEKRDVLKEHYYVVMMEYDGDSLVLIEVKSDAGGMTMQQRADAIAGRMTQMQGKDAHWFSALHAGKKNGEAVVAAPAAAEGYVITADAASLPLWNLHSTWDFANVLTQRIQKNLRIALNHSDALQHPHGRDAVLPHPLRHLARTAVDWRLEGDTRLSAGDRSGAAAAYLSAIKADPNFVAAYVRLASVQLALGQRQAASGTLRAGLQHGPDGTQRSEMETLLRQAR